MRNPNRKRKDCIPNVQSFFHALFYTSLKLLFAKS